MLCTSQIDRVTRKSEIVSVLFSARHQYRLQHPAVIVSLCSLLLSSEIAIRLRYTVSAMPTEVSIDTENHQLCWIRSGQPEFWFEMNN